MEALDFPFQEISSLTFKPRPQSLPANLRPLYRIALIILVLKLNCRMQTASLLKLQFFNWLLKSPSLQDSMEDRLSANGDFTLDLIHLDPMVNLALKYAFADNLIVVTKNSKYKLTDKGDRFATLILKDDGLVLSREIGLLKKVGKKVSEVKLKKELL